jgi:ABC-type nitrate/sulfonate/bicarbonate transport system permease component
MPLAFVIFNQGETMKMDKKYSTFLLATFMTLAMDFTMTLTMTLITTGLAPGFLQRFIVGFLIGFIVGLPTSLIVLPSARKLATRLTTE